MSERKHFLLRLSADLHETLEKWAADELRSINGQIEYLLADAARKAGRLKREDIQQERQKGIRDRRS
jgi:hypothetical protein